MKSSDIVLQLAANLPKFTDYFTENLAVSSLSRSGTTVSVITGTPHGLTVNKAVNISGAKTPIVISTLTRSGIVGEMVTDSDHDLTENYLPNVEISGASEAEFNGEFKILSIPNRRTIKFQMANSGATTATGSPLLENGSNYFKTYNGLRKVTAVSGANTFEYEVTDEGQYSPAAGTIVVKKSPRISSSATFERLLDVYTEEPQDSAWLYVVLGDVNASKSRKIEIDSTDNIQRGHEFDQRIIQTIDLFAFLPTTDQIAAREARDICESLFRPICRSILFSKFDTLLSDSLQNPLQFHSHGLQMYNTAYYVHRYSFEMTAKMSFEDTVGYDDDVAFRNIIMEQVMGGIDAIDSTIDLDDEPL